MTGGPTGDGPAGKGPEGNGLKLVPGHHGTRLVLARHGETPSNVRRALDTLPPGPGLTDQGRRQAHALAERLAADKVLSVHASRALRAQETARPLATRHGLQVNVVGGTHEVYVGDLEGATDDASRQRFDDIYGGWHLGEIDEPMPGGETGRQVLARFLGSAQRAVEADADGSVVMVSHGAMVRLVAGHLAPNIDQRRATASYLPNTGTIVLDADPDSPTGWYCTAWDGLAT